MFARGEGQERCEYKGTAEGSCWGYGTVVNSDGGDGNVF